LLKAALRLIGLDVPKWHDVEPVLRREAARFPIWFQKEVRKLAQISRKLRRERELSMGMRRAEPLRMSCTSGRTLKKP